MKLKMSSRSDRLLGRFNGAELSYSLGGCSTLDASQPTAILAASFT